MSCAALIGGTTAGCGSRPDTQVQDSQTSVVSGGSEAGQEPAQAAQEDENAKWYQAAVKVGYTEGFKYVTKGYTVGSGDEAEEVIYFMDLVREQFPNAEFVKIEDQYDTAAVMAAGCDVVVGLDTYALQALKQSSGLKEYRPVWADEVSANLNDVDNQYFAIAKDMIISVYRMTGTPEDSEDVMKQKDKETFGGIVISDVSSVTDLWKEGSAYIGKYELDRYFGGWDETANKTFLAGLLSRYIYESA